jgi:O-methyltransferase
MNVVRALQRRMSTAVLKTLGLSVLNYRNNTIVEDPELVDRLMNLRVEGRALQSFEELMNIHTLSRRASNLPGDFAELGVYKGGTARLIARNKGSKELDLFDSFEGMADTSQYDIHHKGDFHDTSLEDVQRYLNGFERVSFHRGWFPETGKGLEGRSYAFVHLDVDLYQSTLDGLQWFHPRLVTGGMMLSHDYNALSCPGVAKAYEEFFSDKQELIIELAGTSQCVVVKR